MGMGLNSAKIIDQLKKAYNFKTDKQLADFLGIPNNTLSNWKLRNTLNWELIYLKCERISFDFLVNDLGEPFIETENKQSQRHFETSTEERRKMLLQILTDQYSAEGRREDKKINILFVDDEPNNLYSFKATYRTKYKVYTALGGEEALEILEDFPIDIIITDQRMPKMTGIQFLEEVIKRYPEPMRILMTGYSDISVVKDAINKGKVFYYLEKPWSEDEVDQIIVLAYAVYLERKKSKEKTEELEVINKQLEFLLRQKLLS